VGVRLKEGVALKESEKDMLMMFFETLENQLMTMKENLDYQQLEDFIKVINESRCIFVMGAGRSGYIAKAFAMRLMHLGYDVYVVGETVTPRIASDEVLISISGSGETTSVVNISRKAKKLGCKLVSITCNKNSTLAGLSDVVVIRDAKNKDENGDAELSRIAPLGTLFEITSYILLDALVAELMHRKGLSERDLAEKHAVLE